MVMALKMFARFLFLNRWRFTEVVTISYASMFVGSELWWAAFFVYVGGLVVSTVGRWVAEDLR
ncbi:hypothetical protein [Azorhizobium doebereinerae]|uniref:hypothetical protein n=1 Tax=Azorhizobium doebereinerae TaxID=281091 RepID=UPI00048F7A6E|nr:hypothetical protein [Azorhizobium doebereinerae]